MNEPTEIPFGWNASAPLFAHSTTNDDAGVAAVTITDTNGSPLVTIALDRAFARYNITDHTANDTVFAP
jgi:hypothetical protein